MYGTRDCEKRYLSQEQYKVTLTFNQSSSFHKIQRACISQSVLLNFHMTKIGKCIDLNLNMCCHANRSMKLLPLAGSFIAYNCD